MSDGPRLPSSPLGRVSGISGSDPVLVARYAKKVWQSGGALIMPYQMERLSADVRAAIDIEMKKAYGNKEVKNATE